MGLRWYRVRPLLGVGERVLPVLGLGFVLEYHRTGDRLEIYYLSEAARVSFNKVAAVEEKTPPDLPPYGFEVRVRGRWWLPVEVRDWHGLLEAMEPGTVVQAVGLRDHRLREKLLRKAESLKEGREYTAGRVLISVLLGEQAFRTRQDEVMAQRLRREAQSVYQLALRVYAGSEEEARELAEQLLARLIVDDEDRWKLERIRIKKSKDMARLRDPLQLKKGDTSWPWLPEDRLASILELPEPTSTLPVDFARGAPLPSIVPKRSEIRVGELHDGREIRIDVDDLYRHAWIIGRTGAGKSTFIVNMVLRLWETGKGAVVVIDPHGDLARDIVEAAPTLEGVVFLDPDAKPFGLNPIELPKLPDRDLAKSVAIDNVVAILEKVFRLPETAVNVKFILRTLLGVLYEKTSSPTLADLYEAIIALYNGELELEIDDPMWRAQVELLREMQEQSFISALNRLQPFATNPLLRRVSSKTTVDLGELIEKRSLVIFSIPKAYGETVSALLASTILLKLWFYVLERSLLRKPRTPVFVFIDEFQNVGGLPVIETILSEARKYGLHLIAAHQHTKQLPEELLQSLLTNTALKVVFAVEGPDVQRLRMVDPDFAKEIEKVLPSLTVGTALLRVQARPGEEPYPPLLIRTDPPPPRGGASRRPCRCFRLLSRPAWRAATLRRCSTRS